MLIMITTMITLKIYIYKYDFWVVASINFCLNFKYNIVSHIIFFLVMS